MDDVNPCFFQDIMIDSPLPLVGRINAFGLHLVQETPFVVGQNFLERLNGHDMGRACEELTIPGTSGDFALEANPLIHDDVPGGNDSCGGGA